MPYLPKSTCSKQGCPEIATKGAYCDKHYKERAKRVEDFEMRWCVKAMHSNEGANNHDFYVYGNHTHHIGRLESYDLNGVRSGRPGSGEVSL